MAGINKYTPEEKANHISRWKSSGITQKEYCLQHNIKYLTFGKWLYNSRSKSAIKKPKVSSSKTFIPIRVTENVTPSKNMTKVEIEFPDGTKLRIH